MISMEGLAAAAYIDAPSGPALDITDVFIAGGGNVMPSGIEAELRVTPLAFGGGSTVR